VQVDGADVPRPHSYYRPLIAAVLILAAMSAALVLIQRPNLTAELAGEEAVAISEAFLEARGNWDHQAASSLVSDTAAISITPARSFEDLEMEMAWLEATGWVFTATGCSATRGPGKDGARRVLCYMTHENAWSRVLGMEPDTSSTFTLEVNDGQIVGVFLSFAPMSFPSDAVISFETWLNEQHPEDQGEMYRYPGFPSLTPESIELWRQHTEEFVAQRI
jgi:hypothetical protein